MKEDNIVSDFIFKYEELQKQIKKVNELVKTIIPIESIEQFREVIKADLKYRKHYQYYTMCFPTIYSAVSLSAIINYPLETIQGWIDIKLLYYK